MKSCGKTWDRTVGPYRDELVISTKAGYDMWPGPYGNFGSRKYLLASLDQSLKRMGLDYVDIFYSHRPDPDTPVEETMSVLDHAVRSGKALYAGLSNYNAGQTRAAVAALKVPCLIHQMKYSMFQQWLALVCDFSHTFVVIARPGSEDACDEVIPGHRARVTLHGSWREVVKLTNNAPPTDVGRLDSERIVDNLDTTRGRPHSVQIARYSLGITRVPGDGVRQVLP